MAKTKKSCHLGLIMGYCKKCRSYIKFGQKVKSDPLAALNKLAREMGL